MHTNNNSNNKNISHKYSILSNYHCVDIDTIQKLKTKTKKKKKKSSSATFTRAERYPIVPTITGIMRVYSLETDSDGHMRTANGRQRTR